MRAVTLAVAVIMAALSTAPGARAEIEIAVVGPMSGQYSAFGEQMRRGAKQAVKDINAGGGVLDQELELIIGDDQCDPIKAVEIANRLPSDGVGFVAGHLCSAASIHASRIYAEEGIIQISPASTDPKLTDEGGSSIFRVSGREDQQGRIAGRFLARVYGEKKIAIIHNSSTRGRDLAGAARTVMNEAGVAEALYQDYEPAAGDYTELMKKLRTWGIEVFYVGGHHAEGRAHDQAGP